MSSRESRLSKAEAQLLALVTKTTQRGDSILEVKWEKLGVQDEPWVFAHEFRHRHPQWSIQQDSEYFFYVSEQCKSYTLSWPDK